MILSEQEEKRFWDKVNQSTPHDCWLWKGGQFGSGYGCFHYGYDPKSQTTISITAHRMSWALHHNNLPPSNKQVCHSCDNPICVNPKHLWLGTAADNALDKMCKGRHKAFKGILNGSAKLNESEVLSIKNRYSQFGEISKSSISRKLNLDRTSVTETANRKINYDSITYIRDQIRLGKSIRAIAKKLSIRGETVSAVARGSINNKTMKLIQDEWDQRVTIKLLASEYNVSQSLIRQIVSGTAWAHLNIRKEK